MICDACQTPAVMAIVSPGTAEERAPGGILLRREVPEIRWCLDCAILAGWPSWPSERGQVDMLTGDVA